MGIGGEGGSGMPTPDMQMSNMPIVGGMFPDESTQRMEREMAIGARNLSAYRPEAAQARRNAMMNRMSGLQGGTNILTAMSGGKQPYNTAAMQAPIIGPSMMAQGRSRGWDTPGQQAQIVDRGRLISNALDTPWHPPKETVLPGRNGAPNIVLKSQHGMPPDIWGAPKEAFANPGDAKYFDGGQYDIQNKSTYPEQPAWPGQPPNRRW